MITNEEFDEIMRLKNQGYLKYSIDDYIRLEQEYKDKLEGLK